ncbi:MAG: WbqC family protein [Bacteroidota bacterium]
MKLAIMQAYFFPYLGYFQLINAVDKFLLYENISFRKESWMTRNRILAAKSKPFYIRLCVKSKSSNKKISEIKIVDQKWKLSLLKNIHHNYKFCEYYHEVMPLLEKIIHTETDSLHTYNSKTICMLAELLGITTIIEYSNTRYLNLEKELHLKYPKQKTEEPLQTMERKTERIISIARQEKADVFINAIGGSFLYSKPEFTENNLNLFFISTKDYKYQQSSRDFFQDLSIIDVLLNCGIEGTKELLNQFELV